MNTNPRYRLTYAISPEDFTEASSFMGREASKKLSLRWVVMGSFFSIFGVSFLLYLLFSTVIQERKLYLLAAVLLLIGVYNILCYTLLYPRSLPIRALRVWRKSDYLQQPVTLTFYNDYIQEESANGDNRLQWQAVKLVRETPTFYAILFTRNSGIVIPKGKVPTEEREELDEILREAQDKFGKQRLFHDPEKPC